MSKMSFVMFGANFIVESDLLLRVSQVKNNVPFCALVVAFGKICILVQLDSFFACQHLLSFLSEPGLPLQVFPVLPLENK